MIAVLQQIENNMAVILTEKNYKVVVPVEIIPMGAHVGDKIHVELKMETDEAMMHERMAELENEYISKFY